MNPISKRLNDNPVFRRMTRMTLVLVVVFFLLPVRARAVGVGDIILLLRSITTTLQSAIGGALSDIQKINATVNNLHQEVVWPVALINQTKGFVTSMRGRYQGLLVQIQRLPTTSATLANPLQLESVFRSGNAGGFSQVQGLFNRVYRPVPQPGDAQSLERNMMDMDDALAVGSIKTAMVSDQTSQTMISLADTLEQQAASSAPGSAGLLSAQARIANLENQAYLARMLAAELRQSAAHLAHENSALKKSADSTRTLRNQMQQLLSRP